MKRKLHESSVAAAEPLIMRPGVAYTSAEVARFLRLKPETLEIWRATGRYPALRHRKPGGKILYMGEDVLAFLDGDHVVAAKYVPKSPRLAVVRKPKQKRAKR
jgi:hypothetical protein